MQNNNFFTFYGAEKYAAYAFLAFGPDFEEPFSHGSRVRFTDSWPEFFNHLQDMKEVGKDAVR